MIFGYLLKFSFKVELFTAKDLVGAKLIGKPDPYAVITCGNEKRFRFVDLVFFPPLFEFISPRNGGARGKKLLRVLGDALEKKIYILIYRRNTHTHICE